MRTPIAILKLCVFVIWCAICVPCQLILLIFHQGKHAYTIPRIWHNGVCKIFSLTVTYTGTITPNQPTLFVSNHISWLDIPVIGSVLHASFVAKREVESWPLFGFLSKLQQTAFIDRSRHAALREKNSLKKQLETGKSLILFPEGTSSDGTSILPFKSSLFEIAQTDSDFTIQPFCLKIHSLNQSTTPMNNDLYAWYGDMDLAPHLWTFAKAKGAEIHLTFLPPIKPKDYRDRKALSGYLHQSISQTFDA